MRQEKLVGPAAAVLAVVAGLGCVLLGVTTVLAPGASMTAGAAPQERPATGVLPAALVIPALDLVVNHLVDLGHIAGRREQPGTAMSVGWFADGPAPGAPGVAVLSGHTGFGFSRGAFARLGTLPPGSAVMVRDDEGREARFTVRRTETFAPDEPDSTLVAPEGPGPELRLITSDGSHDTAGMNGPRVAVYATPV